MGENAQQVIAEGWGALLVVNVASMSEPHDNDQQDVVLDRVDNSVSANPDS
jgi:hypothetical protein